MYFCYYLVHNYGLAIILFTLISKIVLLPVSVWVQKNSIKMVKMQPEINRIKKNISVMRTGSQTNSPKYSRERSTIRWHL